MARPKTIPVSLHRFTLCGWIGCTSFLGALVWPGCASSRQLADAAPTVAPEHSLPMQTEAVAKQVAVATQPASPTTPTTTELIGGQSGPIESNHTQTPPARIRLTSARLNRDLPKPISIPSIDTKESENQADRSKTTETTPTRAVSAPNDHSLVAHEQPAPDAIRADEFYALDLNLPSALAMIDAKHPVVGLAQWQVEEAYARLRQAKVQWLPTIQAGFSLHRHDGNYQASNGEIVDVNRNSFQYGLGMGATGAGTTQRPGLVARFHLADALFQPKIAKKTAWARGHAARAVVNDQLLRVAIAYNDLLRAHQDLRIVEESRDRMNELFKITDDFAQAGEGLRADADRVDTERLLVERSIVESQESIAVASARLAEALSIDASTTIMPMDVHAVALDLNPPGLDKSSLIQTGLTNRPELKESQALVAAACEAYQREKYAPLVPSVLLGFSTGGFGGGLGGDLDNASGRYDFDALMSWEVRNLGFGEKAARRLTSSQVEQAKYAKIRVMDEVARQVSEAHSQLEYRRQPMALTQSAIRSAQASYDRNVSRIRDGQGLPIEALQSVQALENARRAYLRSVVRYNESQFRLQWALGWPVSQG